MQMLRQTQITQDEESVTDQEMEEELGTENVDGAETE